MGVNPQKDIKALDELFQKIGTYQPGEDFRDFLEFTKNFPKISPYNPLLLHIQKPGSRYVASIDEWRNKFNRTIKSEARPLVILWPFGPVHFVFELGDTEGPESFPEELLHSFRNKLGGHNTLLFKCRTE